MKNKKQLALAVSLAVLGGTALTTQSLAAEVATPSKANELQAGNYVYVTNAISVGTATNSTVGNVDNGTQTYSVEVGYSEDKSATDETLAINVDNVNNKVTGAMATGYGASDTGLLANANGVKSQANGDASLAFGTQAISSGSSTIAIGTDAQAGNTSGIDSSSGDGAIAIGLGSRANENLSLAIGGNAQSSAISSTAIGAFARTSGISSTAIGGAAQAEYDGDIAIGVGSYVNSAAVTPVGTAAGGAGLAVGYLAKTTGASALALGSKAKANSQTTIAIGSEATDAPGSIQSIALGTSAKAFNRIALAVGSNSVTNGQSGIAVGSYSKARGDYAIGVGSRANAIGYKSIAIGENTRAVGDAVAIGNAATVGSTSSSNASVIGGVAIGNNSKATVSYGVKGYDPLNNAVVSEMNTVLTGDNLATYEKNKDAVAGYRTAMENAEKAYKAFDSTYQSKVTAIMNDGTKTDTQKQSELQALYTEKGRLANLYNQSTLWVFATDEGDEANDYGKAAGAWESTNSAFAIGNSDLGLTRQITGVAAGTQDTDAVNVAQLKRSRVTLVAGNNVTLLDVAEDKSTGMVYKVNALRTDVAVDGILKLTTDSSKAVTEGVTTYTVGLSDDLTSKINSAAKQDLSNLSDDGKTVVRDLAKASVIVTQADDAQYISVTPDNSDANKTTYKVGLNLDSLKAGLTAGDKSLATKADVTGLSEVVQNQIKSLTDSQLKEADVKDIAKDSIKVIDGVNTTVTEGVGENGAKTFAVNVSNDAIKNAVQPELDKKLNSDGSNLKDTLVDTLKDRLGVNDAQQGLKDVNSRIDATNTLDTEAHDRITDTNTRVNDIDTKVQTIDGKVTTIEGNVSTLRTDVNNISANVSTLNTNVDTLTTNVNTLTTDLGNLTNDVNTLSENVGAIASDVSAINNRVGKLDQRLDKVGASAAALAALHPLQFDEEDKFTVAAGIGNYKGEQAMALGAFYQANEDTLFSVGGTLGDENMVNLGVSLRFGSKGEGDRPSGPKAVRALTSEVATLQAKNTSLENTVATQQDRLAQQEAELAAQRQLIEQLVAKVGL